MFGLCRICLSVSMALVVVFRWVHYPFSANSESDKITISIPGAFATDVVAMLRE